MTLVFSIVINLQYVSLRNNTDSRHNQSMGVSGIKQVFPYHFVWCDDTCYCNWVNLAKVNVIPSHDSRSEKPQRSATLLVYYCIVWSCCQKCKARGHTMWWSVAQTWPYDCDKETVIQGWTNPCRAIIRNAARYLIKLLLTKLYKQECIPVGWVPSARSPHPVVSWWVFPPHPHPDVDPLDADPPVMWPVMHAGGKPPPPPCEQTDRCTNITFANFVCGR